MGRGTIQHIVRWSLVCGSLAVALPAAAAFSQAAGDQSGAARAFAERIERYARLRGRLEEPLPAFAERRGSWSLMLTRRYLASAIRASRTQARLGDIFAPPVTRMFRSAIAEGIYEVDVEGLVDGTLEPRTDLVVNEPIPERALQVVPAPLVERFPALPAGIEYRMVSGALVLWDVHAAILIAALPDAFAGP